jgi:hypothetical protein
MYKSLLDLLLEYLQYWCIIHFSFRKNMLNQLHLNDRKAIASQLHITVERFDDLVASANHAYEFIKIMGPFYGREDVIDPTFRTTAEPVRLPVGSRVLLNTFGEDLLHLGRSLSKLPAGYKKMLGTGLDYRVPVAFRIDTILDTGGIIRVNEVEGMDGASALMMIEQLAYGLQPLSETTVGRLVESLKKIYLISEDKPPLQIGIVRSDLATNPYSANARRFIELIHEVSHDTIKCELFDIGELRSGIVKPDWMNYHVVLNETYFSPQELYDLGVQKQQLLAAGNYNALVNKGIFALIHEPALRTFWIGEIGEERYERLLQLIIPSRFISTKEELDQARNDGKVVKVTWGKDMAVANRSQGVAMPYGVIAQSSEERWNFLYECLENRYTIIAQDYVEPAKIHAYLRKKGTTLESVEWHNRICVKYIVDGNPNGKVVPDVYITATEVTLGPDIVPAGRKCAFTAGLLA